jgi:hypothetical protein
VFVCVVVCVWVFMWDCVCMGGWVDWLRRCVFAYVCLREFVWVCVRLGVCACVGVFGYEKVGGCMCEGVCVRVCVFGSVGG